MDHTNSQPASDRPPNHMARLALILAAVCVMLVVYRISRKTEPAANPIAMSMPLLQPPESASVQLPNKLKPLDIDDDPMADGWDTEAFNRLAGEQLNKIKHLLQEPTDLDAAHVRALIDDGFICDALSPAKLVAAYEKDPIKISRAAGKSQKHHGIEGFVTAMQHLLAVMPGAEQPYVKFKLYQVEQRNKIIDTRLYFTLAGKTDSGNIEINATWKCVWRQDERGALPILLSIEVEQYEQAATDRTLFTDVTESVLGDNESYRQQLLHGTNYWTQRLSTSLGATLDGHLGLALGDVNGDGLEDLYYCDHGGLPNRLYLQNPDGSVTDRSAESGVNWLDYSNSALLIDLDNDGDLDLVVTLASALVVMANDGSGRFEVKASMKNDWLLGMVSASDYDNDGDLDIYTCVYFGAGSTQDGLARPIPYHDAENGGRNILFRNEGDWQFTDVTADAGLDVNNTRFSLSASWEDFDNDGDQDLYVTNDFGRNCLYRNDGGRFVEIAAQAGVQDIAAGMSTTWSDYNHDGLMDLYISNMFSSAGSRVTYQQQFKTEVESQTRLMYQRHARGNTLFENAGDGTFRDVSVTAGVTMGRWAWSSLFADLNNDGLEDLIISNGQMTNEITDDL